jgi:hypothetical protein
LSAQHDRRRRVATAHTSTYQIFEYRHTVHPLIALPAPAHDICEYA